MGVSPLGSHDAKVGCTSVRKLKIKKFKNSGNLKVTLIILGCSWSEISWHFFRSWDSKIYSILLDLLKKLQSPRGVL